MDGWNEVSLFINDKNFNSAYASDICILIHILYIIFINFSYFEKTGPDHQKHH